MWFLGKEFCHLWPTGTHFLNLRLLGDVLSEGHPEDGSCAGPGVPRGHLPVPCFPQKGESAVTPKAGWGCEASGDTGRLSSTEEPQADEQRWAYCTRGTDLGTGNRVTGLVGKTTGINRKR